MIRRLLEGLRRFRRPADVWLFLRMLGALLRLPSIVRRPIREVVGAMAPPTATPARFEPPQVAVYVRFLVKTMWYSRRQPCLYRALLLYRFLPEAGLQPRLFFGAKRGDPGESAPAEAPALAGHAWVEAEGAVVLDSEANVRQYTVAFSAPESAP